MRGIQGCIAQGMRFAERWIASRDGLPGQKHAQRVKAEAPEQQARRSRKDMAWREMMNQPKPARPIPLSLRPADVERPAPGLDLSADLQVEHHDRTDGWA